MDVIINHHIQRLMAMSKNILYTPITGFPTAWCLKNTSDGVMHAHDAKKNYLAGKPSMLCFFGIVCA
jgi:hypothetical protein